MEIKFVGLKHTKKTSMVWCVIFLRDYHYIILWGRKGGKLRIRNAYSMWPLEVNIYSVGRGNHYVEHTLLPTRINEKLRENYQMLYEHEFDKVQPNFKERLEKIALIETLKLTA